MRQRADGSGTADQRREQMLRAALEVIVERGYPYTRIADVAQRAGTSPALVIYYFKTKDQLLTEAIRLSEDTWYATGTSRVAAIDTAAGRLEELIAMSCLPEEDDDPDAPNTSWLLWLDLWTQAARHPEVAGVRQKFDERWRDTITSLVVEGQDGGRVRPGQSGRLRGDAVGAAGRVRDPDRPGGPHGGRRAGVRADHAVRGRRTGFHLGSPPPVGRAGGRGQRPASAAAARNGARAGR